MSERKRRKWDVPAPNAAPPAGNPGGGRAGIGATSLPPQFAGFVTGQGLATAAAPEPVPAPVVTSVPANKPGEPLAADVIARAQKGAAAAMEKINRDLLAKGLLAPNKAKALGLSVQLEDEIPQFGQDVVINNAPPQQRYLLTKRMTQEEIQRRTGTNIVNRGRYFPPGALPDEKEKPLFLRVTPGANLLHDAAKQAAVAAAVADIHTLMAGQRLQPRPQPPNWNALPPGRSGPPHGGYASVPPPDQIRPPADGRPPYGAPHLAALPPGKSAAASLGAAPTENLYLSFEPPPEFNVAARLQGPGGAYFEHIAKETSSALQLRGRGSGSAESAEPLHVFISSSKPSSLQEAKALAQNLIDTVKGDFQKAYPDAPVNILPPTATPPQQAYPSPSGPGAAYAPPPQASYGPPPSSGPNPAQPPAYGSQQSPAAAAMSPYGAPSPQASAGFGPPPTSQQPQYPPSSQQQGYYLPSSQQTQPSLPQQQQQQQQGSAGFGPPPPSQQPQYTPSSQQQQQYGAPPASGPPSSSGAFPPPYPGQQPAYPASYPPQQAPPPQPGYASQQPPPYYPQPGGAPYYPPPGQPPMYTGQQQPPPPFGGQYGQQGPASQGGAYGAGGYGGPGSNGPADAGGQQQPPKRRFREFKEGSGPGGSAPQANPYQQQQAQQSPQNQQQQAQQSPQIHQQGPQGPQPPTPQNTSPQQKAPPPMGPPPPRPPPGGFGMMGPPPPRQAMGPPPPRPARNNAGSVDVAGGFALVNYGDDD